MMSSGNSKRKLSQNDLRLLMSQKKRKLLEINGKIESPLAKYLENGTLMCVICNAAIKSESIWHIHINAKQHRDNIARKKQKEQHPISLFGAQNPNHKNTPIHGGSEFKPKSILKNRVEMPTLSSNHIQNVRIESVSDTNSQMQMEVDGDATNTELPEGFFDDPILDARARNVEYRDQNEEEWERFQKEIREENTISQRIVEDDHDEAIADREIDIIDEQMHNWTRVLNLEVKKEAAEKEKIARKTIEKQLVQNKTDNDEDSSYGSEDEFEEYLDWRSKRSFK